MIEFNLLPDIKLEYLKTEKTKRKVFLISLVVAGFSTVVIILLFAALQLQSHQISSNKKQIQDLTKQLTGTTDINKVLTIQNQLKTVVGLANQTPQTTRIYGYLPQLVPQNVTISSLSLDFTTNALKVSGDAPDLETINTFADTLKFAQYSKDGATDNLPKAFSGVVLQSFSRGKDKASYSFGMNFDPVLFDKTHKVVLVVPKNYVSTRSFTDLPSNNLFKSSQQNNQSHQGNTP